MTNKTRKSDGTSLAALVAPEDMRIGDFVAVLNEITEFPAIVWCDSELNAADDLIRVQLCASDGGTPLRIKAICLPFVYVASPEGTTQTIDVRKVQLVRLKNHYSKTIWNDLRKKNSKKRKKKKKKRKNENSYGR